MTTPPDLPSLEALEPFGWIFTPGPLPVGSISAEVAQSAIGIFAKNAPESEISLASGSYTEKGRYRLMVGGQRVTLYSEHPVWAVSIVPPESADTDGQTQVAERYSRHTLVDARTGRLMTQFLLRSGPGEPAGLDLHAPLTTAELTHDEAIHAAIVGEERMLTGLPTSVEYGSRWRLIPGFVQVTDVWRVTFDTSSLPPLSPAAEPEVAWVVIVDDKAGHRWLSAAVVTA
jgi:hypothetical protein